MVLLVTLSASTAHAQAKQVVLLQSFERGNLVLDTFTATLREQVGERSAQPVNFTEFVISPAGFANVPDDAIVRFLRTAFATRAAPDVVVTSGGIAAAFARRHRADLFTDSPLIYAAVDERFLATGPLTDREAAVAVANRPGQALEGILQLFPDTERIFIVMGAGALGQFWRQEVERESVPLGRRVELIWPDRLAYAALLQRVSTLPPRSAVFIQAFDVDTDGTTRPSEQVLADFRAAANVPVFGAQSAELGHGIVGGNLMSIDQVGRTAADVVLRVLAGESPGSIKTPVQEAGPHVFDWRELQRWGIQEARLPPGSVVHFREPGLWERYRWVVVAGVSALGAETLLISSLLISRRRQRRAEGALRESEGRFRELANAAPVMIRMSGADGLATDFNLPWLTFTGREIPAEQGSGWLAGVHLDDARHLRQYRIAVEHREPYRLEYRLRRADGEYRWLLDSGKPRLTPDGTFVGYVSSAIDITELKAARAALTDLNRRLIDAQERERLRIARELHDDVCQQVSVLALSLDQLNDVIAATDTEARSQVNGLYQQTRALGEHVSGISHRLHSSKLDLFGLTTAAEMYCREVASRHGVPVRFVHRQVPPTLPDGVAINLFRVLQEALANALKHSGASRCRVTLRTAKGHVHLEVSDDGCGFDPAVATLGLGLVTMQERLALVHGKVAVQSTPGGGTKVVASAPLVEDAVMSA